MMMMMMMMMMCDAMRTARSLPGCSGIVPSLGRLRRTTRNRMNHKRQHAVSCGGPWGGLGFHAVVHAVFYAVSCGGLYAVSCGGLMRCSCGGLMRSHVVVSCGDLM